MKKKKKKKRGHGTRRADRYFLDQRIGIKFTPLITGISAFYLAIEAVAYHENHNGIKCIARVIAFSRTSSDDLERKDMAIGESVAKARAKRGLYTLLHGRVVKGIRNYVIHDPLCQGVRL
jgi:hypothetical protein